MALAKLAHKCRACPKMLTCDHKEMEAIGFLPIPAEGLVNPDQNIMVGVDWAHGPDSSSEVKIKITDSFNSVGNPYPASNDERKHAIELLSKECRYGKLD